MWNSDSFMAEVRQATERDLRSSMQQIGTRLPQASSKNMRRRVKFSEAEPPAEGPRLPVETVPKIKEHKKNPFFQQKRRDITTITEMVTVAEKKQTRKKPNDIGATVDVKRTMENNLLTRFKKRQSERGEPKVSELGSMAVQSDLLSSYLASQIESIAKKDSRSAIQEEFKKFRARRRTESGRLFTKRADALQTKALAEAGRVIPNSKEIPPEILSKLPGHRCEGGTDDERSSKDSKRSRRNVRHSGITDADSVQAANQYIRHLGAPPDLKKHLNRSSKEISMPESGPRNRYPRSKLSRNEQSVRLGSRLVAGALLDQGMSIFGTDEKIASQLGSSKPPAITPNIKRPAIHNEEKMQQRYKEQTGIPYSALSKDFKKSEVSRAKTGTALQKLRPEAFLSKFPKDSKTNFNSRPKGTTSNQNGIIGLYKKRSVRLPDFIKDTSKFDKLLQSGPRRAAVNPKLPEVSGEQAGLTSFFKSLPAQKIEQIQNEAMQVLRQGTKIRVEKEKKGGSISRWSEAIRFEKIKEKTSGSPSVSNLLADAIKNDYHLSNEKHSGEGFQNNLDNNVAKNTSAGLNSRLHTKQSKPKAKKVNEKPDKNLLQHLNKNAENPFLEHLNKNAAKLKWSAVPHGGDDDYDKAFDLTQYNKFQEFDNGYYENFDVDASSSDVALSITPTNSKPNSPKPQ